MTTLPTSSQLAQIDDEELQRLGVAWRAQASRGQREAFGIAHALEVELRRRTRDSQIQPLPQMPPSAPRSWWKFWRARGEDEPTPPT